MTSSDDNGKKQELAEQRTDWAQERTLLAKKRTYASWVRTGLASLTVGLGGAELLGELEPQWLVRGAGAALVIVAAALFLIGFFGYRGTFRKLEEAGVASTPVWLIGLITGTLVISSLASLMLVLLN